MSTDTDAHLLLDALFDAAPVGIAIWSRDLRYQRVNPALAAINGLAPGDHVGRGAPEVLGELGREVERSVRSVYETGLAVLDLDLEGETPALPGERRHWRVSYYPVTADGEVLAVGAVVVEVTRELEARRQEQTATALLDAVFDAAPVGIAFWDLELRYRRVNGAYAEMNGLPAEEHLGRRPDELLGELGARSVTLLTEVARTGEAAVDRQIAGAPPGKDIQYRQKTVYPVRGPQGEVVGLAGVIRDATEQHRAEKERTRLLRDALAARAAAEAAQVRAEAALAEAEAARRRTDFLARTGERLAALAHDYEQTLQEVARVTIPVMADWCTFTLVDRAGGLRTVAVAAADAGQERLARQLTERYPPRADAPAGAGRVVRTGESQLFADIPEELLEAAAQDEEHLEILRSLGLRSALTVPLRSRDRILGALSLAYSGSGRHYDAEDVRLAELLAVRAALSVENARLYSERSHIAQTLQRSLLPPALPEVPGLELAAGYRAAGDENEVGGDFYDAFPAAEGAWTLLIGDVSGKGAEAAALTSLTRHTLRAAALRDLDPCENLRLLNQALWAQAAAAGRFCTVLYAQVRPDAAGADVTLATGGHLPPYLVRSGGRVERVQLRGSLVGGLREPTFGERSLRLEQGDLLLLFTDGVVELRSGGGTERGERALEEVLAAHRSESVAEIVEAVERRAAELHGGEPRDDLAMLAIRSRPTGAAG
jgi:PAS domain S-box-containing protein